MAHKDLYIEHLGIESDFKFLIANFMIYDCTLTEVKECSLAVVGTQ